MLFLGEGKPSPDPLPRALRAKKGIEYERGSFLREALWEGLALPSYEWTHTAGSGKRVTSLNNGKYVYNNFGDAQHCSKSFTRCLAASTASMASTMAGYTVFQYKSFVASASLFPGTLTYAMCSLVHSLHRFSASSSSCLAFASLQKGTVWVHSYPLPRAPHSYWGLGECFSP